MNAAAIQTNQQAVKHVTEERFFDMPPRKALPLVKAAVEHATGTQLVELADGMWEGRIERDSGYREVTVRALPMESGTNVEITMVDHASIMAITIWGTLFMCLAMLIIPIFFMIAYLQRAQREAARSRLIQMHKTWKEISAALGAPKRASYRDAPRRVYAPAEDRARVAEEEALAAEEAEREAEHTARV